MAIDDRKTGNMRVKRVVLTGGGTGGHIYPALALAAELRKLVPQLDIVYVGTKSGLESQIVPKSGLPFVTIRARGLVNKSLQDIGRGIYDLICGYRASRRLLAEFKPQVAVGTGGYVTGPVLYAAARMRIPIVLHEQNAYPGAANRWLSRYAQLVAVPFEEVAHHFPRARRVVATGNPIRPEILQAQRAEACRELQIDCRRPTVLIMSGSRGARTINYTAARLLSQVSLPGQVILITGKAYYEDIKQHLMESAMAREKLQSREIRVFPYLDRIELALAVADLVIARAGATTIAELTARGIPSILVPSPNVTHDHQRHNAAVLARAGAAVMLDEQECNVERLHSLLLELVSDSRRLQRMSEAAKALGRPNAGLELARLVLEAGTGNG